MGRTGGSAFSNGVSFYEIILVVRDVKSDRRAEAADAARQLNGSANSQWSQRQNPEAKCWRRLLRYGVAKSGMRIPHDPGQDGMSRPGIGARHDRDHNARAFSGARQASAATRDSESRQRGQRGEA
jgi:hypothetical protein